MIIPMLLKVDFSALFEVKALRQREGFCALDNPRAWLFQVVRNALVDRLRVAHRHEPLTDELADTLPLETQEVAPIDALADCLSRTLGELSAEDEILRACDLDGQTQRAFAAPEGIECPAAVARAADARVPGGLASRPVFSS
jgi:RNA polymerase sigma-70 factor, ECF subfamily